MDPVVVVISTNHSSDNTTSFIEQDIDGISMNCTPLNRLDLVDDVFTRMDIGNAEFWGSESVAWMTFFIIYYVLFYVALVVLLCYYGYLFYHAFRVQRRSYLLRRTFVYSLILHSIWFVFSFVHSILVINSVANGSDRALASVARTFETITSSSFNINIILVAPFFSSDSKSQFPLFCALLFTIIIYSMALVIVMFSISAWIGSSATIILLINIRLLMFIVSVVMVTIFVILYGPSVKTKGPLSLLWNAKRSLVIVFPYFLLSCSYFVYTLSTVASNGNCIENVQLHRPVWLVLNYLLRLYEVSFSIMIVYFMKTKVLVSKMLTDEGQDAKPQCYSNKFLSSHSSPVMLSGPIHSDPTKNMFFPWPGDSKKTVIINESEVDNSDRGNSIVQKSLSHSTFKIPRQLSRLSNTARKCDGKLG